MEIKSWLKNIGVGVVKNGCDHPGLRTLKLAIPQKVSNGTNWFLVCWQKFKKAKIYFNNFWMVVIENGRGLVALRTLKSAVSQPMNWADFLHADTNLWKLKITLIIIGWVWSKMGKVLKIVGLLNQVYLTNDLMNWADWMNDFCMLIVMEYHFFAVNDALYWLYENCMPGKNLLLKL